MTFIRQNSYLILLFIVCLALAFFLKNLEPKSAKATVSGVYEITQVDGDSVYGKAVNGSDGIYYKLQDFKKSGIQSVEVGDVVEATWDKADYEAEYWEQVELKLVSE